jgi:hypothetical protein
MLFTEESERSIKWMVHMAEGATSCIIVKQGAIIPKIDIFNVLIYKID